MVEPTGAGEMSGEIPEQQLLDKLTRQDELQAMTISLLKEIRDKEPAPIQQATPAELIELLELQKKQHNIDFEVFTLTYPRDGTRLTIAAGKTTFDFLAGTVAAPGADIADMGNSLMLQRKEFMRALFINANKETVVRIGSGDKIPVRAGVSPIFPYRQFTTVAITVTESTEILISASTNPASLAVAGEAVMKGWDGSDLKDIAVDVNGNMVTLMKGDDGANLQTIKVDATGQMYVAMTGQSLSVDNHPSDYLKPGESVEVGNHPSDYLKPGESVDVGNHPSDYFKEDESAVVKGDDGGTKRLIAVDPSGIMLSRMKGAYGGVLKDILLDDTGIMLSRMKGAFGGALKDIGVDTNGNMITIMKGAAGNDVAVDANGYLAAAMKGLEGANVRDIAVDASGQMITILKGAAGNNVAVDASGRLAAMMKGLEGANVRDIAVDPSGIMLARMKGAFGGALKDIGVDTNGNMITIIRGATGNDVAVDASGNLSSVIRGSVGTINQDAAGNLVAAMKGLEGANVRDIAVDANGNMISVMKGDYEGALKTWKVDTDGRGEMFLNDPTDVWGTINPMGLGEAMVRSHAPPMVHDKRGTLVRWIDFESATPNYSVAAVGTPTHSRSTDTAFNGDNSYKCVLAQYDQVELIQSTNDYSEANMRGASAMFASADSDFWVQLEMRSWNSDNTAYKFVRLRFDSSTGNIIIYNDLDFYVIDTVNYYSNIYNFSTLKLVTDMSGQKYTRATVFGVEYDLSAYSTGLSLTPGTQHLETSVKVDNQAAGTNTIYLDNILMTENEPDN